MGTVAVFVTVTLVILLIAREASSRRALAELRAELAVTRADVRGQEQLASVGQLVSGLAQELKSPLQGVIGNAELMLASGTLGVQSTSDLREIQENATRAAGLVRNLLAFTETADLTRRWHDINDVMDRAITRIRTELDAAGVVVQFVRAERLPLMYVDARQIEKVVATLLSRSAARPAADMDAAGPVLAVAARRSRRLARHRGRRSHGLRPWRRSDLVRRSRSLPPDRPGARRIARSRPSSQPADFDFIWSCR